MKWSLETVKTELIKIHGEKYIYDKFTHYENLWQKIEVFCTVCKLPFEPYINNHLKKKTGCPNCGKIEAQNTKLENGPTKKIEDYIEEFNIIHNNKYSYIKETYKGSNKEMKILCPIHGEFLQKPSNHRNGKGCPKCGKTSMIDKLKFSPSELKEALNSVNNYEYDESTYINTKEEMKFICQIHGEFWQRPMNQLRQGAGCPKCSTVKAEKELLKLFPNLIHRDRKLIEPLEIDLVDYQNQFGIEFNGNLWHSFGKTFPNNLSNFNKNKHLNKTNLMEEKAFQLFHILDIDWNNPIKKEIWLSIINNKLRKSNRLYARKLKIIDLSSHRAFVKNFLNNNHLQGFCNYKYAYGLIEDNIVFSIMTFGKSRFEDDIELLRFCNVKNFQVVGGASKLLKHFERIHNPNSIVSYAKRDWSQGNLYKRLGFEFVSYTEPSKFYLKNSKKYCRQKFQKHKLEKCKEDGLLENLDGLTAEEILLNNNYRIFFDSGNIKFRKTYKGTQ